MTQKHLIRAAVVAACLASGAALAGPLGLVPGTSGSVPVYAGRVLG
jgi:hypothetical protein